MSLFNGFTKFDDACSFRFRLLAVRLLLVFGSFDLLFDDAKASGKYADVGRDFGAGRQLLVVAVSVLGLINERLLVSVSCVVLPLKFVC